MTSTALVRPVDTAADWTIPKGWHAYLAEDHHTWDTLFERQAKPLPGRVAPEFIAGLGALRWLSSWLEAGRWYLFGIYCIVAAGVVFYLHSLGY